MTQISMECLRAEPGEFRYFRIDDAAADVMYRMLLDFWSNRPGQTEDRILARLDEYRESNKRAGLESLRDTLPALHAARPADAPFSILDLGGANGSIYYLLTESVPAKSLHYVLIEPFARFVDDFKERHPNQHAIAADAEAFAGFDAATLPDAPYGVFFGSVVMCMLKPALAARVIATAARFTDDMVIWDVTTNARGELDPVGPVLFDYFPESQQWYFAHHYERYLDDAGFEIVSIEPTFQEQTLDNRAGFATLRARRRG